MTSITGAPLGFIQPPLLLLADFLQGKTKAKEGIVVPGILGLPERNRKEHVRAENRLMHAGSFQEKKGFMLHCALSVWRCMTHKTYTVFIFSSKNV